MKIIKLFFLVFLASCFLSCLKKDNVDTNQGLYDLYVYNIKTGENTRITDTPSDLENPIGFTADSNKIVYNTHEGIFVINADGSDRRLLFPLTQFSGLQLSYDGKKIAFTNDGILYLRPYNGIAESRLTNTDYALWNPVWSKNGEYIACSSDSGIVVVNMLGDINIVSKGNTNDRIDWSSDSKKIVYSKFSGSYSQLFVYDLDLKTETKLTATPYFNYNTSWRPGTSEILFTAALADYGSDLILFGSASDQKNLLHQMGINTPVFSPDGNKIAFINENSDIALINVDGADYKVLNDIPQDCLSPIWSKDGNMILYNRAIFYTDLMID